MFEFGPFTINYVGITPQLVNRLADFFLAILRKAFKVEQIMKMRRVPTKNLEDVQLSKDLTLVIDATLHLWNELETSQFKLILAGFADQTKKELFDVAFNCRDNTK